MDRFDPFVKYADVYGDIINWEKDPMNKPQNQNKYFFSDGKTYYEQICKMLRLMSVFKEAFNQIYNNEDEISEAWENFVNNLSASVVEGSEPDVTLTWTDDSVNFEFTMVPGVQGDPGVGITSISFNSDYTMTITLSDGTTYTSMSLKGDTGPQGPQGETGSGLQILDVYATLSDLQSAHPTGQPGDAYQVGSGGSYTLYIWSSSQSAWIPAGSLGTVSPSTSNPLMDGTASAGSSDLYSRGDHVHPSDTSRASKEELDALIRTSQSLIDQSFTYRESPAIQDGLARIDKIKGNTLVWNQLLPAFTRSSDGGMTWSYDSGLVSVSGTATNSFSRKTVEISIDTAHKYALLSSADQSVTPRFSLSSFSAGGAESSKRFGQITQFDQSGGVVQIRLTSMTVGETYDKSAYLMVIDLTQMFGAGNEPTSVDEFVKLYPLPYYQYNAGELLSFNGTGIKTVGFNQWDGTYEANKWFNDANGTISNATGYNLTDYIKVIPNQTYYNANAGSIRWLAFDENKKLVNNEWFDTFGQVSTFTVPSNVHYVRGTIINANLSEFIINISSSRNGEYEPYKEETLSLPIAQHFPNGMRRAGNVYDELTPNKAVTRLKEATYSSSTGWTTRTTGSGWILYETTPSDIKDAGTQQTETIKNNLFGWNTNLTENNTIRQVGVRVSVRKDDITSLSDWNTYLASNPLEVIYPLATPTEEDVDLDLSYSTYEGGTEQLLPVNGPVPSTSPIIADITYLSIDDAMEYILGKLANVPENTQQILDSLEDDVSDLQTDTGALQTAVSGLQTSVRNINTNIGQLSSTVAGHTSSISDMQSDITDISSDVSDLATDVGGNTGMINQLTSSLASTDGRVQNLSTSVSALDDTVTAQGTTVTELDSIIQDISNNPVGGSIGNHELGFVLASVEATLPANTGTMVTIPKPTIFPNNYTPLFIVGMSTGSYNVSICSIPYTFGNNNSVTCRVWNHGSQQTTQISVYILCMRQRQSS